MKKLTPLVCVCLMLLSGLTLWAQEPYKLPPKDVMDIVLASPPPQASINPDGTLIMLVESQSMPDIAYMSQPLLRIAGTRILPKFNARQVTSFNTAFTVKTIADGKTLAIDLPEGAQLGTPRWSPDGKAIAFLNYTNQGCELWVADTGSGKAKKIPGVTVNAAIGSGFDWLDSATLLVQAIPEGRGAPPAKPEVPHGPNIQETAGRVSKVRTYQDLLKNPYDEALFDYYGTSQLCEVSPASGQIKKLGDPAIYTGVDPSPDKKRLLVRRIKRPYSYLIPYYSFGHTLEIWNREGEMIHLLGDIPLAEGIPLYGVPTGIRSVSWRARKPATLIWVEALDGGDPEAKVDFRDKIMTLSAPFNDDPREVYRCKDRFGGGSFWMMPVVFCFITESDWKRRWRTTYLANLDDPTVPAKKIWDLSNQDSYNDPGRPIYTTLPSGERVPLQDKDTIYLSGSGSSPKGDMPFLDTFDIKTGKTKRLFQCAENSYEVFIDFLGNSRKQIIIRRESKTEPPNYFLYTLKNQKKTPLTAYEDPAPQMTGMKKQRISYSREDGVDLYGTLYLPPDYKEGERLPCVIWAYPREFNDPRLASQVRGSDHRFTFFRGTSQLFYVTQGYAVLDGAQMPVLGDPKTMNDTFVEQIVAAAKAAIDKLDEMGVIDPGRVGVGGHSYGAFMTANLLAHCDLFAAGCARSGAYNRTLTPFGFQSERRTLWQAPDLYFKVSPFMHADKINEPILLIHGEADNNSGTFPIQSQRLFHALKGHGATARLVMLPNESHGYRAKESTLHVLAEMISWFDKYVKNK
jgi:dipeptidyl aminopeptidase/acylaminoacyl peptidase